MDIKVEKNGATTTISPVGRIDTTTSPELEEKIKEVIDSLDRLIFDFASVDYISSSGLRVLLSAQKIMNKKSGSMTLTNVKDEIMEIFEVTGFDSILSIE